MILFREEGDTIDVNIAAGSEKIRLNGINSTESGGCFPSESSARFVLFMQGVEVRLASDVSDRDQCGCFRGRGLGARHDWVLGGQHHEHGEVRGNGTPVISGYNGQMSSSTPRALMIR
jgi:hypothetical protein